MVHQFKLGEVVQTKEGETGIITEFSWSDVYGDKIAVHMDIDDYVVWFKDKELENWE